MAGPLPPRMLRRRPLPGGRLRSRRGRGAPFGEAGPAGIVFVSLTLFSHRFLDFRTAILLQKLHASHGWILGGLGRVPDLLLPLSLAGTVLAWAFYLALKQKRIDTPSTRFCRLIGISLPSAYIAKDIAKILFGRVAPRYWLLNPDAGEFHWLHGASPFFGFPSGHMVIATTLASALCAHDPGYAKIYIAGLALLGLLLIFLNLHFISDVLMGACLGWLVHRGACGLGKD